MPSFIEALGGQAAGQVVGTGLGLALGGIERKAQLKQQTKLQNLQIAGQMEMGKFNREQQMKLWEDTNYSAQMAQLKKAGLNPGLIYGMGGGAGGSTQANTGSVSGGQAASSTGAAQIGMAMQQAQLIAAQTELVKAQTKKTDADTGKTGVDTEIAKLEKELREYALPNAKSMTDQQLTELRQKVQILFNERTKSDMTVGTEIALKWTELTQAWANVQLTRAGIGKTQEETNKIATEIGQMAQKLQNETNEVAIKQQLADFETKWGDGAGEILKQIIGNIPGIGGLLKGWKKGGKK